ncbi:MAG: PD-(D/E)XK nuclease family protein, partial [Clostridia bacterium]|nr:PD-(D/E)XK nuclease family protein [Clostridia bacterium]
DGNDDGEIFTEGLLIAGLIKKITSEAAEGAGEGSARYGYGDVVILTRSKTEYARRLTETLVDCDIPVTSEVKKDVTVYPEIRHLVSLLRVVDCAEQDIPLCAVMRGPTGRFTDAELAEIRLFANNEIKKEPGKKVKIGFCDAVRIYMDRAEDCALKQKLGEFFAYVEKLRFLADYEGAGGIVARAVRERGVDLYYLAGADGKNRIRRINKLVDEAGEGSFSVREFLERLDADTEDVSVTDVGGADAVRLMSIHSAKGLEFPVVILAGLQRQFAHTELSKPILHDRKYGFAIKTYELDGMVKDKNILDEYLRRRYRFAAAVEEMRVLYVALTRAKSRLYLTANANEAYDSVSPSEIAGATSYLKMIPLKNIFKDVHTVEEVAETGVRKEPRTFVAGKPDEALGEILKKNLSFRYPHDTTVRSKSTVTALLRSGEEEGEYTPVIIKEDEPDARTVGDAYHRFLELLDFEKCLKSQLIEQKSLFAANGDLPCEWADLIDEGKVEAALKHDFFHVNGAEYFRELPFEVFMPSEMIGEGGGEEVLVQGVIDVIAFTPQGIRIADYKVSSRASESLKEKYKKQLDLYAYAAEKITGKKVVSKTLFNLKRGETVDL